MAGDFNGDGRTDLAVANDGTIDVSVLLGNGDGTFQHQVRYAVGFEPDDLVAGDFTGDGHTDLAVANYTLSLSLHPRSPRVLRRRGWSYLADDANRPAAHDFDEALQFAPKDADAFSGRGLAQRASAGTRAPPAMPSSLPSSARRTGESRATSRVSTPNRPLPWTQNPARPGRPRSAS